MEKGLKLVFGTILLFLSLVDCAKSRDQNFDVLHYDAVITPDIDEKSVSGSVTITLIPLENNVREIVLSSGRLEIVSVKSAGYNLQFNKQKSRLLISLASPLVKNSRRKLKIDFHGKPAYGIRFFPERNQVYTVFSTSQWMPCVDSPDDRASFRLKLVFPGDSFETVGNGRLVSQKLRTSEGDKRSEYVWEQKKPVSTYLFGFAAGDFKKKSKKYKQTTFRYVVPPQFSESDIAKVFRDTADMLQFFEQKAGVKYPFKSYTQVLAAGNAQQEMSGFTVMGEKYGLGVLKNEKAIWLGAHEFAHQWWGNMVTNRDWTHFWLNEGITNFMTAAYFEHRFGRKDYLSEIEKYRLSYEKIRKAGNDKSLVFPDWNRPSRDDRRLVYNKGAYVMDRLRKELGEKLFWKGLKSYTRKYWGKSVVTRDFRKAMEDASGRNLSKFFNKWVYLKKNNDE